MGVSKNRGTPISSPILIGFSMINHAFWGTPIFGNTHMSNTFIIASIRQITPSPESSTNPFQKPLGSPAETKGERGEGCNLRLPKSSQLQSPTKERHPRGEHFWLVVSSHLKNISQIGNLPQIGVNIKNI